MPTFRYPALDGLRGLAALAVLGYHGWILSAWNLAGVENPLVLLPHRVLSLGWAGVDLFFVLSAFLLSLPFVPVDQAPVPRVDLRDYARRRALRILPAYYAQLLLVLTVVPVAAWQPDARQIAAHLLLWLNIGSAPVPPLVPVWWSLPVECGFYLLLPLLARLLRPRRWWLLCGVVALALCYRAALLYGEVPRALQMAWVEHLPGRIDQFALGMLAAYAWRRRFAARLSARHANALAAAAIAGLVLITAVPLCAGLPLAPAPSAHPALLAWHTAMALACVPLLWAGSAATGLLARVLAIAPLRAVGAISYSLYLWHLPIMLLLRDAVPLLPENLSRPFAFLLLTTPLALAAAWLSWRVIERPLLRRRPAAPG